MPAPRQCLAFLLILFVSLTAHVNGQDIGKQFDLAKKVKTTVNELEGKIAEKNDTRRKLNELLETIRDVLVEIATSAKAGDDSSTRHAQLRGELDTKIVAAILDSAFDDADQKKIADEFHLVLKAASDNLNSSSSVRELGKNCDNAASSLQLGASLTPPKNAFNLTLEQLSDEVSESLKELRRITPQFQDFCRTLFSTVESARDVAKREKKDIKDTVVTNVRQAIESGLAANPDVKKAWLERVGRRIAQLEKTQLSPDEVGFTIAAALQKASLTDPKDATPADVAAEVARVVREQIFKFEKTIDLDPAKKLIVELKFLADQASKSRPASLVAYQDMTDKAVSKIIDDTNIVFGDESRRRWNDGYLQFKNRVNTGTKFERTIQGWDNALLALIDGLEISINERSEWVKKAKARLSDGRAPGDISSGGNFGGGSSGSNYRGLFRSHFGR